MSELPVVSGSECARALEKLGFYLKRQKGSHLIYRRDEPFCQVVVPKHKTLDRGTLKSILGQAELGVDEFVKALKS